jgi:hypothetical protein
MIGRTDMSGILALKLLKIVSGKKSLRQLLSR